MLVNDKCPYCGKEVYYSEMTLNPSYIHTTVVKTRRGRKTTTLHMAHLNCAYPGERGDKMQKKLEKGELSRRWLNKGVI